MLWGIGLSNPEAVELRHGVPQIGIMQHEDEVLI